LATEKSNVVTFAGYRVPKFNFNYDGKYKKLLITLEIIPNIRFGNAPDGRENCVITMNILMIGKRNETAKRNNLKLELSLEGYFISDSLEIDEELFEKTCKIAGINTLIPLARALILSFTSQAGMTPLKLPMINVQEFLKDFKEKK